MSPKYLDIAQILKIHERCLKQTGGLDGVRELRGLESAIALPRQGFGDQEFYPLISDKAAILGFTLILNHPFLDGNKRTGFLSMEMFLLINGYEIIEQVDIMESIILSVASGQVKRDEFAEWLKSRIRPKHNS
ncbi:MAG: type II toxin-antitoxin system death-on-curing family toxin [Planctomycetota bacterium]|nr:type II toxin-antitoxin system death-on-curing family toxin [Planctomycetota bacterium]